MQDPHQGSRSNTQASNTWNDDAPKLITHKYGSKANILQMQPACTGSSNNTRDNSSPIQVNNLEICLGCKSFALYRYSCQSTSWHFHSLICDKHPVSSWRQRTLTHFLPKRSGNNFHLTSKIHHCIQHLLNQYSEQGPWFNIIHVCCPSCYFNFSPFFLKKIQFIQLSQQLNYFLYCCFMQHNLLHCCGQRVQYFTSSSYFGFKVAVLVKSGSCWRSSCLNFPTLLCWGSTCFYLLNFQLCGASSHSEFKRIPIALKRQSFSDDNLRVFLLNLFTLLEIAGWLPI